MPGSLNGTTVPVSPTTTTIYSVTGTDGNGCTNTATVNVNVNQLPTVNAYGDTTICSGNSVLISATGADTYLWMPGLFPGATVSVSRR